MTLQLKYFLKITPICSFHKEIFFSLTKKKIKQQQKGKRNTLTHILRFPNDDWILWHVRAADPLYITYLTSATLFGVCKWKKRGKKKKWLHLSLFTRKVLEHFQHCWDGKFILPRCRHNCFQHFLYQHFGLHLLHALIFLISMGPGWSQILLSAFPWF